MDARTSRRHFLYGGAAAGAGIWLPFDVREADARARKKVPLARAGTFPDGILSGDPSPTAVTFWTRLQGGGRDKVRVELELARDKEFRQVVLRRLVPTRASRDHTVKVRVSGLQPDKRYFYRFTTKTTHSDVGRTQTAPGPDSRRAIKVGYFACQDFSSGYFGAYKELLAQDPDIVICGGDYIYDRIYDTDGYGGVREDKTGANGDSVALVVGDYRNKYRLARTDADLRELHRHIPFVPQWDDHEVTDNYVGTLDKSGADDGDERDTYDRARIVAGHRAWHDYMPTRSFKTSPDRIYRRLKLGKTVDLFMCDSRSYREDQPCGGGSFNRCDDAAPRQYLGAAQLNWLKNGLAASPASWKLIGNQLMIMPFQVAPGTKVEVDSWQGYPAQRTELLTHIESKGVKDVVFLTGDIHTFFAGSVLRDGTEGPAVATELVGGSTTSPGTAEVLARTGGGVPPELIEPLSDQGVPRVNPWITYADTRTHGCALVELAWDGVKATYLGSADVKTLAGSRDVRTIADLRVARGTPGVTVASRA